MAKARYQEFPSQPKTASQRDAKPFKDFNRGETARELAPSFYNAMQSLDAKDRQKFFKKIITPTINHCKAQVRWHAFGQAIMAFSLLVAATGVTTMIATSGLMSLPLASGMLDAFQLSNQVLFACGATLTGLSILLFMVGVSAYQRGSQKAREAKDDMNDIRYVLGLPRR